MAARTHIFETDIWLPAPVDRVFAFFADASNLDSITPPWLRFRILTPMPLTMSVGAILDYRISLHGFPITWRTRISEWAPPFRFADEQLKGPYYRWYHVHTFEELEGGTVCRDRVEYSHPGGLIVHSLLVRPDVERIFRYRQQRLQEIFGHTHADSHPRSLQPA